MVKLESQFDCKKIYKEINSLIKSILDTRTEEGTFQSKSGFQIEEFESIFFNHLFEKTNLMKELNTLKISCESIRYLYIIAKIELNDDNYFAKFLILLNEEIERLKCSHLKNYTLLFPLNVKKLKCEESNNITGQLHLQSIKRRCETLLMFKKILGLFNIRSIEKQSYYDRESMEYNDLSISEKMLDIVGSYGGEVLRIDINAIDGKYALKEANINFEAFLGFLSFIYNNFRLGYYRGNYQEDFRMFKIEPKQLFIFTDDEKENIFFDIRDEEDAEGYKKELLDLKLIDLNCDFKNNLKVCSRFYNLMKFNSNNMLKAVFYDLFSLYYAATSEKRLEYSFFKFWIITEYLIKKLGKKNDNQMLRIMKKIVKLYNKDPFLSKRIDFLYKKRNKLVHEGEINIITQDDRNLSKLIADCILDFYLFAIQKFKLENVNDFDFLITNIGKEEIDLNNHSRILNKIAEWKSPQKKLRKLI